MQVDLSNEGYEGEFESVYVDYQFTNRERRSLIGSMGSDQMNMIATLDPIANLPKWALTELQSRPSYRLRQ